MQRRPQWRLACLGAAAIATLATSCTTPLQHTDVPRSTAEAPDRTADTRIGRIVSPTADRHPGKSGIMLLDQGEEAFLARPPSINILTPELLSVIL